MAIHPYLTFGGNCREAFTRYEEIFGGDLTLLTMAEMPDEAPAPPEQADMIMHAALRFGGDLLMASDDPTGDYSGVRGIHVNFTVANEDEARRVFDALAEGGSVTMPLDKTFWSPAFGMCVDRFGIPWMVNVEPPAEG